MRKVIWEGLAGLALVLIAAPAGAQWTVFDPANVAQAVLIAERTLKQYETLTEQYQLLQVLNAKLPGGLAPYRTSPIVIPPLRNDHANALIEALTAGDARGALYRQAVGAVPPLPALAGLTPEAQASLRSQVAHVEISDAVAERAIHQTALITQYAGGDLERAITAFEEDSTAPRSALHYLTAILGKLTGAQMIGRRQDTAINQELSHALELLIVRNKQQRDTDAIVLAVRLAALRGEGLSIVSGSAAALTNWRQP